VAIRRAFVAPAVTAQNQGSSRVFPSGEELAKDVLFRGAQQSKTNQEYW